MSIIPEKLINYAVYKDSVDLLGIADVTLPDLNYVTSEVAGAGIAGKLETPVIGHYESMVVALNFRTRTQHLTQLLAPEIHHLELRESSQEHDSRAGKLKKIPGKLVLRGLPKSVKLGKAEMGATTDSSAELEVSYLKLTIDNEELVEIDKLAYIARIGGEDCLAEVRSHLGKEG